MMLCKMILKTPRALPRRPTSLAAEAAVVTLAHVAVLMIVDARRTVHAMLMIVDARLTVHAMMIGDVKTIVIAAMIVAMIACARRIAGMIAVMTVVMTVAMDVKMIAVFVVTAMMMTAVMVATGVAENMMIAVMVGVNKGALLHHMSMLTARSARYMVILPAIVGGDSKIIVMTVKRVQTLHHMASTQTGIRIRVPPITLPLS
jgi:hypothetical protein